MKQKVTIGICVKDSEDSIGYLIKSIIGQDFPHENIEVIFVDDGSEDKTLQVIEKYLPQIDMRVKIFYHEWRGLGASRNVVVNNACGDYLLWIDGDMIMEKEYVNKVLEFMEKHPRTGIVKGKLTMGHGSNLLGLLETYSRASSNMIDFNSKMARSHTLGTGGSMYRIETFLQVGGFDESLKRYGEDWDIELRIRTKGWEFHRIDAYFHDYERFGLTWKHLWRKYWIRGYYHHFLFHKNSGLIKPYKMIPPAALLLGLLIAHKLFKITHRKVVFLLPFLHLFKMSAWSIGFIRSHLNSYEPRARA